MEQELIKAIKSKNLQKVQELLAAGANPNAKQGDKTAYQIAGSSTRTDEIKCALIEAGAEDSSILSSLVWVINTGRVETVKALLARGADLNVDTFCGTPIQNAAKKGFTEIVNLLIEAGADVNASSGISTALLDALEKGHNEIALKLIAAGADPKLSASVGHKYPIAVAAICSSGAVIKALVNAGSNVDVVTKQITLNQDVIRQQTGAALASAFNLLEKAGKAINKLETEDNPDVNETVESFEIATKKAKLTSSEIPKSQNALDSTPVIIAARCGNVDALKALLEAGADPHCKDGEGLSAYEWAVKNEFPQVLSVLKGAGVDQVVVTSEEKLIHAAKQGNVALVQELIQKGADVNCGDRIRETKNYTPLMLATLGGYVNVVETLLSANANPNLSDDDGQAIPELLLGSGLETIANMGFKIGQTSLMLAVSKRYRDILQKLLAAQAEVNYQDKLGNTALFLACQAGHLEIAEILLNTGADVNLKKVNQASVILAPAQRCNLPLIKLLVANNINVSAISQALAAVCGATQEVSVKESDPQRGEREYRDGGIFEERSLPEERILEAVELLLNSGAEVNTLSLDETPISAAATRGYLQVIQYLLDRGANPEIKNEDGYDALDFADLYDQHQVLEFLKQYTGKLNWKNRYNRKDEEDYEQEDMWGEEVAQPDFTEAANNPEYQQAVADLSEICGSKPIPLHHPGWYEVPDVDALHTTRVSCFTRRSLLVQ